MRGFFDNPTIWARLWAGESASIAHLAVGSLVFLAEGNVRADKSRRLERSKLDRQLLIYGAGALAAGLAGTQADAAVVYTPGPLSLTIDSNLGTTPLIDFDNNVDDEFTIGHEREGGNANADRVLVKELETNGATGAAYLVGLGSFPTFPAALSAGATIGPAGSYDNQFSSNVSNQLVDEDYDNNGNFDSYTGNFSADNTVGNVQYVGVKFRLNDNAFGDLHYGWIGVDITNQSDLTGVVTGYAYNDTPDTSILAGEIPEPSSLALLAMGASGMLIRRRQSA